MKVGDMVKLKRLGPYLLVAKDDSQTNRLGVVVDIHAGQWPKDWELTQPASLDDLSISRRIDILWSSGVLTKDFPERALDVVKK
jgi:hypothetical protein